MRNWLTSIFVLSFATMVKADGPVLPSASDTPTAVSPVDQAKHLFDAAQSLRSAGRVEAADAYQREAQQLIKPQLDELKAKREQLRVLADEIQNLEQSVGCPSSVVVKLQWCSVAGDQARILLPRIQQEKGPFQALNSPVRPDWLSEIQDKIRTKVVKVHSEPQVIATSGHRAKTLSGVEIPLSYVSGDRRNIAYREFGYRFEVTPTFLGSNRVDLDLEMEDSGPDLSSKVEVHGIVIPGIRTRRVVAQIEAEIGETYLLRQPEHQGEVFFSLVRVEAHESPLQ